MSVIRCEHCERSVDTDLKPTYEICEKCADILTTNVELAEHLGKTVAVAADAVNRANQAEATRAALVEALEAIETACKIPFSQVLVQEMAQNALKLAKGE